MEYYKEASWDHVLLLAESRYTTVGILEDDTGILAWHTGHFLPSEVLQSHLKKYQILFKIKILFKRIKANEWKSYMPHLQRREILIPTIYIKWLSTPQVDTI